MTEDLSDRYTKLVDQAREHLKATEIEYLLGLTGPGHLAKRLRGETTVRKEHVLAMERIVEQLG